MLESTAIRNGRPEPDRAPEPGALETLRIEREQEQEVGDFILRHVLEKDAVFFEG